MGPRRPRAADQAGERGVGGAPAGAPRPRETEETMREATKLCGWSAIVGLLVVGAFFAGRLAPADAVAAAPGAPTGVGRAAVPGESGAAAGPARFTAAPSAQAMPHVWFMVGPGTIPRNPSDR